MSMPFSKIPNLDTHYLIFGGDLNCVINNNLNKSVTKSSSSSALSRSLISLTNQIGCVDPWHFFHPSNKGFSFFFPLECTMFTLILITSSLTKPYFLWLFPQITLPLFFSDHALHILDISFFFFLPAFKSQPQ